MTDFMTDPALLQSLEGQQYCVLRSVGAVDEYFRRIQSELRRRLPDRVSYPHTGHITLGGFSEPDRVEQVGDLLEDWASAAAPLEVSVQAVDSFPPPFKTLILRVVKTPEMAGAYSALSEASVRTGMRTAGERLSVDDWIFHLSVAYCAALDDDEWLRLVDGLSSITSEQPAVLAREVEFVWYADGEHRRAISLGGAVS